jgi:hypothetical protein
MRRRLPALGALALLALACDSAPSVTPQERAAMGPAIVARLKNNPPQVDVKVEITGAQSEHLKIVGLYMGDPTVETMAYRGVLPDICKAGFTDIDMSDGMGWQKIWKC